MNIIRFGSVFGVVLLLAGCGASKTTNFYVLNPLPPTEASRSHSTHMQVGIEYVSLPDYADKPELAVHDSAHHVTLEDFYHWAEMPDKNVQRVIETNLSTLIPGAVIQHAPWTPGFKPQYTLQIVFFEYRVDFQGNSLLRAQYRMYQEDKLLRKVDRVYREKVQTVSIENLVISMNNNVNRLSRDIANHLLH